MTTLPQHYRPLPYSAADWNLIDSDPSGRPGVLHCAADEPPHYLLHFDDPGEVIAGWPRITRNRHQHQHAYDEPKHFPNVSLLLNVRHQSDWSRWAQMEPLRGLCKGLGIHGLPHEELKLPWSKESIERLKKIEMGHLRYYMPDTLLVEADEWDERPSGDFDMPLQCASYPDWLTPLVEQGQAAGIGEVYRGEV